MLDSCFLYIRYNTITTLISKYKLFKKKIPQTVANNSYFPYLTLKGDWLTIFFSFPFL